MEQNFGGKKGFLEIFCEVCVRLIGRKQTQTCSVRPDLMVHVLFLNFWGKKKMKYLKIKVNSKDKSGEKYLSDRLLLVFSR